MYTDDLHMIIISLYYLYKQIGNNLNVHWLVNH